MKLKTWCCNLIIIPLATRWHTFSYSMKPFEENIKRKMCTGAPCSPEQQFKLSRTNTVWKIGEQFSSVLRSDMAQQPNISERLYASQCLALAQKGPEEQTAMNTVENL